MAHVFGSAAARVVPAEDNLDAHRHALEQRLAGERRARRLRELERHRRAARVRRNRLLAGLGLGLAGLVAWAVVPGGAPVVGASKARLVAVFRPAGRAVNLVPGTLGSFAWPAKGQGAVAVLGGGLMSASPRERAVPIASLTKMMTAYVVLHDHPLGAGQEGPSFVMTPADYQGWVNASQTDESNAPVRVGEVLTEHQLLEALLIPSADNIANFLATWDAGSIKAFVVRMNETAHALGLASTTYADASGVNPGSRSDAADQARLAADLMASPVVRGIVAKPSLAFPVAGTIWNFNPALGTDGIIGVKSGFTSEAQGCLAVAAYRRVGGASALVVAVSLGQVSGLGGAATVDEGLLDTATTQLVAYRPSVSNALLGAISVSGSPSVQVTLQGAAPSIVAWPGLKIRESFSPSSAATSAATSSSPVIVGSVIWSGADGVLATAPVETALGTPVTSTTAAVASTSTSLVPTSPATSLVPTTPTT